MVGNIETTRMKLHWQNLTPLINQSVPHYIGLINNANDSLLNAVFVSDAKTTATFSQLSPFTTYQLRVIGVSSAGKLYKSRTVIATTDEGGLYTLCFAICNIYFMCNK